MIRSWTNQFIDGMSWTRFFFSLLMIQPCKNSRLNIGFSDHQKTPSGAARALFAKLGVLVWNQVVPCFFMVCLFVATASWWILVKHIGNMVAQHFRKHQDHLGSWKKNTEIWSLWILAHLLRMMMEAKCFWEVREDIPIINWEYDWMFREIISRRPNAQSELASFFSKRALCL